MNLSPEERQVGQSNFYEAVGVSRRDFLKSVIATGAVSGAGLGAMYFGYNKPDRPLRVGVIGTGDEGSVLIGALNPDYHEVKAICDIRPYNIHRAFHGDWSSPAAMAVRPGLMTKYGWKSEDEAKKNVDVYKDYHELLDRDDIEGVIIALPLHLHAAAAVDAMLAGKHVLTEKLMAHNVAQCKVMARLANEKKLHLATGHQRHYSVLYDNAVNLLKWGVLGQIHHIRAQWHRGNLPGRDSWQQPLPGGEKIANAIKSLEKKVQTNDPEAAHRFEKLLAQYKAWDSDKTIDPTKYGYQNFTLSNGEERSALEELCRWRLWDRTGGGLMAELGSHQLDAASIFISALRNDGKKAQPLSVHAVGGRHLFPFDRQVEDHVYCMFEFPGPAYDFEQANVEGVRKAVGYYDPAMNYPNPQEGIQGFDDNENKRIVVSYSSINGNGFGGYGEVVLGTKGTLVLEKEQEVMLFKDSDTATNVSVKDDDAGPVLDTQASGNAGAIAKASDNDGPVSRGYTEELEHWAYCIRDFDFEDNKPKCHPKVAMGDAIIALTANVALKNSRTGQGGYLEFEEKWFDVNDDSTPDGSDVKAEWKRLVEKA